MTQSLGQLCFDFSVMLCKGIRGKLLLTTQRAPRPVSAERGYPVPSGGDVRERKPETSILQQLQHQQLHDEIWVFLVGHFFLIIIKWCWDFSTCMLHRCLFIGACILFTGKAVLPKSVSSTSKMRAARRTSGRKGKPKAATATLAHFFKAKAKADLFHFGCLPLSETPGSQQGGDTTASLNQTAFKDKKTATSLILFEEVNHLETLHC